MLLFRICALVLCMLEQLPSDQTSWINVGDGVESWRKGSRQLGVVSRAYCSCGWGRRILSYCQWRWVLWNVYSTFSVQHSQDSNNYHCAFVGRRQGLWIITGTRLVSLGGPSHKKRHNLMWKAAAIVGKGAYIAAKFMSMVASVAGIFFTNWPMVSGHIVESIGVRSTIQNRKTKIILICMNCHKNFQNHIALPPRVLRNYQDPTRQSIALGCWGCTRNNNHRFVVFYFWGSVLAFDIEKTAAAHV